MKTRALTTALAAAAIAATALTPAVAEARAGADRVDAGPARAVTKVGAWTQVSASHVTSLSEPDVLPVGNGMAAVWYQQDTGLSESIRTRTLAPSGTFGPIATVVSGWSTIVDDPQIIWNGTDRLVAFGGIRSTSPSEKYSGAMAYATSGNGTSWSLGTGSLTQTKTAYGSYGTAAIDDAGTPLVGVVAGSSGHVTLHRGIDASMPAAAPDWTTKASVGCCAYYANLGRDAKTGTTYAVWYSNASTSATNGILAEQVYPTPIGPLLKAPGSSQGTSSLDPGQNVAVASRLGGQVWVAYKIGYPTANKIGLWRIGAKKALIVKAPNVSRITLQPGIKGRLWLAWSNSSARIFVTRTNSAVSRFGAVRSFAPPTKKGSYPTVWSLSGTGPKGVLHLVINAQIGVKAPQIWYQRVLPGLQLKVAPGSLDHGLVTATVTDAGQPVARAKVTFRGQTKATNAKGKVTFTVAASVPSGKYGVTAKHAGYARAAARVRVT